MYCAVHIEENLVFRFSREIDVNFKMRVSEALLSASRRTKKHTYNFKKISIYISVPLSLSFSIAASRLISVSSTRSNLPSSCTEDTLTLSSALESVPVCTRRNTRAHTLSPSAFRFRPDI
jgi:hypothetical protein